VSSSRQKNQRILSALLGFTLVVFVLGLLSTAAGLLRAQWLIAFGSLGVTVLVALLAGMLRLWMRAAAIAGRQKDLREDDELGFSDVLAQARQEEDEEARGNLEIWIDSLAPKKRRKLLVSKLADTTLAAEALRIATGIGMTSYVARRACRQGILSSVAEALRAQHANPHWKHAFDFDEFCELALRAEAETEDELAEALRLFIADTKAEHRVDVLAATLPEDLLAGSIVAYAEPEQLIELLERSKMN
jgi:hypothetical protein